MEIHAPEGQVQSVRDVAIHLAIVTVGILIALGLEQTVEFVHHRELVAEARENIASEVRDNKKELDEQLGKLAEVRRNDLAALDFITELMDHGKSDVHQLSLNFKHAEINNTSWTTAQTVGALAFMPYADVKKYAVVYRIQEEYILLQSRAEETLVGAFSVFAARRKLEKLSHANWNPKEPDSWTLFPH